VSKLALRGGAGYETPWWESIDKMNLAEITDCQIEAIHLGSLNPK